MSYKFMTYLIFPVLFQVSKKSQETRSSDQRANEEGVVSESGELLSGYHQRLHSLSSSRPSAVASDNSSSGQSYAAVVANSRRQVSNKMEVHRGDRMGKPSNGVIQHQVIPPLAHNKVDSWTGGSSMVSISESVSLGTSDEGDLFDVEEEEVTEVEKGVTSYSTLVSIVKNAVTYVCM